MTASRRRSATAVVAPRRQTLDDARRFRHPSLCTYSHPTVWWSMDGEVPLRVVVLTAGDTVPGAALVPPPSRDVVLGRLACSSTPVALRRLEAARGELTLTIRIKVAGTDRLSALLLQRCAGTK